MAFSPSVLGCLVKKRLARGGGHGHPKTHPGYALVDISGDKSIALYTSSHFSMHFACMRIILTACMVFLASQTDYITLTLAFPFADMDGNSVKWGFAL